MTGARRLWRACYYGHSVVARALLESGADPTTANNKGSSLLMQASDQGNLEVVRLLLAHPSARATINCRDDEGRTTLWAASCMGNAGIVRALLKSGADHTIASNNGRAGYR
jgi:uncharacterized protein